MRLTFPVTKWRQSWRFKTGLTFVIGFVILVLITPLPTYGEPVETSVAGGVITLAVLVVMAWFARHLGASLLLLIPAWWVALGILAFFYRLAWDRVT